MFSAIFRLEPSIIVIRKAFTNKYGNICRDHGQALVARTPKNPAEEDEERL